MNNLLGPAHLRKYVLLHISTWVRCKIKDIRVHIHVYSICAMLHFIIDIII